MPRRMYDKNQKGKKRSNSSSNDNNGVMSNRKLRKLDKELVFPKLAGGKYLITYQYPVCSY